MTVSVNNIAVIAYANGFTIWHYKTTENKNTLLSDGYFSTMKNSFMKGDIIIAITETSSDAKANMLLVSNINNNAVKIIEIKS